MPCASECFMQGIIFMLIFAFINSIFMATLTAEQERHLLQTFFTEAREILAAYFEGRGLVLSNSQLFSFILVSPITIAIASDGKLDLTETTMLVDTAAYFDRLMPTAFDSLEQPEGVLSDKEFKKIIYGELRYLALSMNHHKTALLEAIKLLIVLDDTLTNDNSPTFSIRNRIKQMMIGVIYNNLGKDSVEEQQVKQIFQALNIE